MDNQTGTRTAPPQSDKVELGGIEGKRTPIKVKTPRDLFSIIPYALGYRPEESILVVCIRTAGGLGMMARTSLSDLAKEDCCVELGKMVARNASEDQAVRAFIVIYCKATDEFTLHGYKKHARHFAEALGHIPNETWVINSRCYYRVGCEGESCCPKGGYPVSELANTEASTALVYRGYAPAKSRSAYLKLPNPPAKEAQVARTAEMKFHSQKSRFGQPVTWRQKAFATWQKALEVADQGQLNSPQDLGILGAALTDTTMRDAVLLSCLPDGMPAATDIIENPNGEVRNLVKAKQPKTASDLLAGVVGDDESGYLPIAPPQIAVRNATIVLEAVAAHTSPANKPGPLTLLAFLAWWCGDGTRANARVRQALRHKPEYPLAVTLADALENRLLPGWIRLRTPVPAVLGQAA
jgi:hypothetical protein